MNLGRTIVDKLNALQQTGAPGWASLKPNGKDGGHVIKEQMDGIDLQIEIEDFDKFSYMVKAIAMTRQQAPPSAPLKDVLLRQSGEIEKRITYLLEGFRLVEIDEVNGSAQVRSLTPYKKGDERLYYEVLLRSGNNLTFTRYRKQHQTGEREIVPSHLTLEIFERLVDDLAAVVQL